MTLQISVAVKGITELEQKLAPDQLQKGLEVGLSKSGHTVLKAAQMIAAPHHFSGRLQNRMGVVVSGSGMNQKATIGVNAAEVPEAGPLSHGWRSRSGKQPPTEDIAHWLSSKGKDPALAFVVARSIKAKGYSFKPLRIFETAYQEVHETVAHTILRALKWRQGRD
jgi:hypothetical protein